MSQSLLAQTANGLKWSYASTVVNGVLQVGLSAVMARLLDPAAFGLVAMAGVVLRFGSHLAQMGIGSALVQKETLEREEVHAAFLLSAGLGLAFTAVAWVLAPAAALVFDQAGLVPVVRALSASFLISGLSVTALSLLRREMHFKALALIETTSYIVGYGMVGLALAYGGGGVWSLIAAALCQSALSAALACGLVRHGISFTLSGRHVRPLVGFGGRVSVIGFLESVAGQLDTLAIGRFLGAGALGLYSRGAMLAYLPTQKLANALSRVLFPSLSRIQSDSARLRRTYRSVLVLAGVVFFPLAAGMSVAARDIVLLLLGESWIGAVPVLQIIVFAVAFDLLTHFGTVLCEATGTLNAKIVIQVVFIALLVALFGMLHGFGLWGFAAAVLLAQAGRHVAYGFVVRRLLRLSPAELLRAYLPGVAYALVVGAAVFVTARGVAVAEVPALAAVAAEALTGAMVLGGLLIWGPSTSVRVEIGVRVEQLGVGWMRGGRLESMMASWVRRPEVSEQ